MKIVVMIQEGDDYTWCAHMSYPIEYESLEAAIVDMEEMNTASLATWTPYKFGGTEFEPIRDFEWDVSFYTVDEWFARFQQ